jgi:hypothetical protein
MKLKELIQALQAFPAESMDKYVFVQAEGSNHSHLGFLDTVYVISQNQYGDDGTVGMINQDRYNELEDGEPNEFFSVKKDFDLMYPANTVFIRSDIRPHETEPEPAPELTKEELMLGAIREGNIPHLRIERE